MNEFFKYLLPQLLSYFGSEKLVLEDFIPKVIKIITEIYCFRMSQIIKKIWRIKMMKLTNEDINKNHVDTIHQYYVLDYLKKKLNINEFEIYLYDKDTIKVIDKNLETGYFKYNSCTKNIDFFENLENEREMEI